MPKWIIESMAQVRRVYIIEAATADIAEGIWSENGSAHMTHEEDITEDLDVVEEYTAEADAEHAAAKLQTA